MKKTLPFVIVFTLALAIATNALAKTAPKIRVKTLAGATPIDPSSVGAGLVLTSSTAANTVTQVLAAIAKAPLTPAQINALSTQVSTIINQNFGLGEVVDPVLHQQIIDAAAAIPANAKIGGQPTRMITTKDVTNTAANIPIQ